MFLSEPLSLSCKSTLRCFTTLVLTAVFISLFKMPPIQFWEQEAIQEGEAEGKWRDFPIPFPGCPCISTVLIKTLSSTSSTRFSPWLLLASPEPASSCPTYCPLPECLGPISLGIFPKVITPSHYFSSLPLRRVAFSLSELYLIPEDSEIYLVILMPFNGH